MTRPLKFKRVELFYKKGKGGRGNRRKDKRIYSRIFSCNLHVKDAILHDLLYAIGNGRGVLSPHLIMLPYHW